MLVLLLLLLVVLSSGCRSCSCCQGRLLLLLLERRMVLIGLAVGWRWGFPLIILKTIAVIAEYPAGQLRRPKCIGPFWFGLCQRWVDATFDGRWTAATAGGRWMQRLFHARSIRTTVGVSLFFPWLIF